MKRLYALIAVLLTFSLMFGQARAGSADFTWTIPNPAFDAPVPADWIIDEYRIYCTIDPGNGQPKVQYNQVVFGYTTDAASYNDIPGGDMTCYMTSWSIKANAESMPSNTVTKFILDAIHPNSPGSLDFTPNIPASSGASLIDNSDPVARAEAKRQRQMERKRQKLMNSNNRFNTRK